MVTTPTTPPRRLDRRAPILCPGCNETFSAGSIGRPPAFCSDRCRARGHRQRHREAPEHARQEQPK